MLAEQLEPEYTSLIMPARWFSGGRESQLAEFRQYMLNNKHIRKMTVYTDSRAIFPEVEIKGGLCYYLVDNSKEGDCDYVLVRDGTKHQMMRSLGDFDILIREPMLAEIVKKAMVGNPQTVDTLISGDTPFGIPTNPKSSKTGAHSVRDVADESRSVKLFYMENGVRKIGFVDRTQITKNNNSVDSIKVFIPEAYGAGETYPHQILGMPEFAEKGSVCSQSYLFAAFNSAEEAHNFISYLKTKFFRALILSIKISQHAPSKIYRFVPIQDFTKPWTDAELYAKYNLTAEEVAFIEAMIKPME